VNGGAIGDSYGLTKATSVQKQQLQQMQTKMNLLSNQINNLTNQFTSGGQQVNQQSETNIQGINNYVKDIKKINKKIKNYDTNYENILQDSDVVVLQQNYDYLFWSIIAVTTVIISMNIVKK
jgi:archaellum component FlaC